MTAGLKRQGCSHMPLHRPVVPPPTLGWRRGRGAKVDAAKAPGALLVSTRMHASQAGGVLLRIWIHVFRTGKVPICAWMPHRLVVGNGRILAVKVCLRQPTRSLQLTLPSRLH